MSTSKRYCQTIVWLALLSACRAVPPIEIKPSGELVTSEDGRTVKLVVSLLEPPHGTLTVRATSSDPTEASISAPLRFDDANWETPQDIVVTGLDDAEADRDVSYEVTVEAQHSGFGRRSHTVEVFSLVNVDDDVARFSGLGDLPGGAVASYLNAMSPAGDVLVGWSVAEHGDEAFRWTWDSGIVGLGGDQSRANNVSADGHVIVGSVSEASYEQGRAAAVWHEGAPIQVVAPYTIPGGPVLFYPVDATVALNSGDWFGACIQAGAYGERLMCHVTAAGAFDAGGTGDLYAGDEAGHLVGTTYPERHALGVRGPAEYDSGLLGSPLEYPATSECVIPHQCAARARAFTADPVTIVGTALVPPAGHTTLDSTVLVNVGFVLTEGEGVARLPDLGGGDEDGGAYAIDLSGRVIGGFGADSSGRHAVVWVDRTAWLLSDVIASQGGSVPAGWQLNEVRAISHDGKTFAGNGTNPAGDPEGFIAVLPCAL